MKSFKNNDTVYQVGAIVLFFGFVVFCWAVSVTCVVIGYGPEVCGL